MLDADQKATLTIQHDVLLGCKSASKENADGTGAPFSVDELDRVTSSYLDQCLARLDQNPNAACVIAFDVDGTFNYRFSGYGFAAKMSFFGGPETASKLRELQQRGAHFVALTGAPESSVRVIMEKWVKNSPDILKQYEDLFAAFKVIKCDPTDTKGDNLWNYIATDVLPKMNQRNSDLLQIEFLDDSVKNAGGIVPMQIRDKFVEEVTMLKSTPVRRVQLQSTWFATGIGDLLALPVTQFTEKQKSTITGGGDYAYGEHTKIDRDTCVNAVRDTLMQSLAPKTQHKL